MSRIAGVLSLIFMVALVVGCEKESATPSSPYILFPAGRSFLTGSEINVSIDDQVYNAEIFYDSCGGYWLKIPKADLPSHGAVTVQYTRRKGDLVLFKEIDSTPGQWTDVATFIDSDNETLHEKAIELTQGYSTNLEKAKQLHLFVKQHMYLNIYHDAFLDKASKSYALGYGACMNFSRLYVAMCRSVNIPARSVWGVIYGYNNDNIYDYHHQWVEVLDEDGYWHPADFDYTKNFDLNDIRYLDLVYAAEENTVLRNRSSETVVLGDVKYFNNYPAALSGRLGFQLVEDNRPDHMTVRYTYKF